ncbi:hypothetical protein [Nocardioides panacisoli]|uniref:SipW-cognate class signal peptide n=1 Tax=Nocardioides panacisoli TaxID=627624 RepID=A0ABP7J1M5_9ACTN
MGRHTAHRPRVGSVRIRALLCLGLLATPAVAGTFAFWTDDVQITGTTLTAATLDINVKGGDPQATSTLAMGAMVPGSSSAEVLPVNNVGTAPAKYSMTGGLTGTDAAAFSTAATDGLLLTIRSGGTVSGSGSTATCSGGTALVSATPLTATTSTVILTKTQTAQLAATSGSESLCFQIKLADTAPSSLQGKTATATFTVTGTSDLS